MRRLVTVLACPGLLLVLAGCGSSTSGSGNGGYGPSTNWCKTPDGPYTGERGLFAAYCDAMERCGIGKDLGYAFACRQECVQSFDFSLTCGIADDEYDLDRWNYQLEQREVSYDEERGAECIAWWKTADCDTVAKMLFNEEDSDDEEQGPEACQDVLQVADEGDGALPGTLGEGEACDHDTYCEEGLYCGSPESDEVDYCDVCMALPGAGEPCRDYSCGPGARCDTSTGEPYLCVALLADGQPCEEHYHCLSLHCYEGACIAPLADGQPCVDAPQCESGFCWEGACMSRLEEGEPCTDDATCISVRCHEGQCITARQNGEPCDHDAYCWYICYQGVCADYREFGESCDVNENCRREADCYQGTCIGKSSYPIGAPCENEYTCASHLCIDGVCAERKEHGEPCTVDEECTESNHCAADGLCGMTIGEDCTTHRQCRSGHCPFYATCKAPLADGEPCTANEECASWDCIVGFCHTEGEVDSACTVHEHCKRRLFCDPLTSTCQGQVYAGEPCTVNEGCKLEYCDVVAELCGFATGEACAGDGECQGFCDETTSLCAPLRALDEDCTRDEQCEAYCAHRKCVTQKPSGVECTWPEECESGICSKTGRRYLCRAEDECYEHEDCPEDTWCNDDNWPGSCEPPKSAGERCDEDRECEHYCNDRYCVTKKSDYSDCVEDEECIGGWCNNGRCDKLGRCWSDSDCEEGQFCDHSLYDPECRDPKPDGSHCEDDEECLSGWCSPMGETCGVQPKVGDPCSSWECTRDAYCLNGSCVARKEPGARCDPTFYDDAECLAPAICQSGRCRTMPLVCEPARAGETCTFLMVCDADSYCDLMDSFTCKRRKRIGQDCADTLWRANTCEQGAFCENGTCVAYAELGESCASRTCEPTEGYCASGTCAPLKYAGEPCANDSECLGGDCDYWGDDDYRCDGPCKMPD